MAPSTASDAPTSFPGSGRFWALLLVGLLLLLAVVCDGSLDQWQLTPPLLLAAAKKVVQKQQDRIVTFLQAAPAR